MPACSDTATVTRACASAAEISAAKRSSIFSGNLSEREFAALVFARVAELLDAAAAAVVRFDGDSIVVLGSHGAYPVPEQMSLRESSVACTALRALTSAHIDDYAVAAGEFTRRPGGARCGDFAQRALQATPGCALARGRRRWRRPAPPGPPGRQHALGVRGERARAF